MSVLVSHPTNNSFVRATAAGLLEANLLGQFHTAIGTFPGSLLDNLGQSNVLSDMQRRRLAPSLKPFTHFWPWREGGRLIASRTGVTALTKHETGFFSVDAVYRDFDRHVAASLKTTSHQPTKAVYAYEDGALATFRRAKTLDIQCLYDLPIGYWRSAHRLLMAEAESQPDWATTLTGLIDSTEKLARKDEELSLADRIFVASSFTAHTLNEYPGQLAPIAIIPYGFPPVPDTDRTYLAHTEKRPLKLLYVGSLSQRKGIAQLFTVAERLKSHIELTVVGGRVTDNCPVLDTALTRHRWIPTLSHDHILRLMREQDVLVFPSLFEGFGLVITEAMSQGTPVITTSRTAGPDLIEPNRNGWLVEAGSTDALQQAIEQLLLQPNIIAQAGKEATETARNRPWRAYGQELASAINKGLETSRRTVPA